jgi:hypothetical protein
LQIGRIFALQKPGYPLQFGRFAAKFRFYPVRVSFSGAVFVINQRFPRGSSSMRILRNSLAKRSENTRRIRLWA